MDSQVSQITQVNLPFLLNYDNPPTSFLFTLCGNIDENPGLLMEETVSKLGEKFASEMRGMAQTLTATSQVELLIQLLDNEDMQDTKKRNKDKERKIGEMNKELDRQKIFARRDNVVCYGIPYLGDCAKDCVHTRADKL